VPNYHEKIKWRRVTKQRMVDAFGGECGICSDSLAFHHLDTSVKERGFGGIRGNPTSWKKIVEELRKCVCVCNNCHGEIHNGMTNIPKDIKRFNESYATYYEDKRKELYDECPECGKLKRNCNITCSLECSGKEKVK